MRKKPVKIKRYRRSFTGPSSNQARTRRIALWVVAGLVLFGIGWLIAKPGIDFATGMWYSHKYADSSSSLPQDESGSLPAVGQESSSAPEQTPAPPEEEPAVQSWAAVSLSGVATPEKAAQTAQKLAQQGVHAAVITLKDETGAVYYDSALPLAQASRSAQAIDAAAVAKAFSDAGVCPVAGIWAFRDSSAPYADRTLAVKYGDTDYNWLDNSQELGGKPWLNPNAAGAQDYIAGLVEEAASLGFEQTVVYGLQFPAGYSLEYCGYGAMSDSKSALLARFGRRLEAIPGTQVWFCFDQSVLAGEGLAPYGDANPAEFGLTGVMVRANSTVRLGDDGNYITVPADTGVETLAALAARLTDGGTEKLAYALSGVTEAEKIAADQNARAAGFTVTVGQS